MLFKDNNHITKNYYLNLFSANAEITKTGNNNFMYEWNIRDLKLGKYCEIALVQLASINTYLSAERQYPPKLFNTSTSEVTNTGEISNIAPNPYYKETITLNNSGITYGSGTYMIYTSAFSWVGGVYQKKDLFNYVLNDIGGIWTQDFTRYNTATGYFARTDCYIKDANYYGDWVILKIPTSILLSRFRFYFRPTFPAIAPSLWRCYGSNDGINWSLIVGATNDVNPLTTANYTPGYYEHNVNQNFNQYNYIGFVVNKVVNNVEGGILNFSELQIFGREEIKRLTEERQYPPKLYNTSTTETTTTGELIGINPTTFYKQITTLNTDNIIYGFGEYFIYSSSIFSVGDQSLYRKRDLFNFNTTDVGGHWDLLYINGTGRYNGNNYIKSDYLGEWVVVKLPYAIVLQRFRFYGRLGFMGQAPSLWKCYGSNDGINFTEITDASNDINPLTLESYDINRMYEKKVDNKISYLYIGFTVNKIINNDYFSFSELQLFGKEELNITNPIMWYQFNGSSTDMLLDSSANKYHLTNNGATFDTTNFKKGYGSSAYNHVSNQFLTIPSINLYNIQSNKGITFSLWIRINSTSGSFSRIFDFNNGISTTAARWIVLTRYSNTNKLFFGIDGTDGASTDRITNNDYVDGNWHHIIWSIDNVGKWTIYIDGVIASFTSALPTNINMPNITFNNNFFGKSLYSGDGYLSGNIDDFRIYDYVLNVNEVKALYNQNELTQNFDEKFIIRSLNCYNDNYDSQNTTSAILFADNQLISPQKATYHKLNTYDLNRISLQVSNDIENKPYNGWDDRIQFGAVLHIKDYKQD